MPWLPARLPASLTPIWSIDVTARSLGGVAATAERVLFSDRVLDDTTDAWKCVSATDGKEQWSYTIQAKGNLDYGNSPRTTPLIADNRVFVLGAFGHLACLDLKSGDPAWELNLRDEFEPADEPKWGACSSPLLAGGNLIVNPGAKDASLVALNPKSGKVVWKSPGKAAGYGSLIAGSFGGVEQIVGHDTDSLGGWDVATGKRLWTLRPEKPNDFNVPTPVIVGDGLLVTTENNGTRLYAFKSGGQIDPKPVAVNRKLAPDTHTPVAVSDRIFGAHQRLYCLKAGVLTATWDADNAAFAKYTAIVASEERVLVVSLDAEFVLLKAADEFDELGRAKALPGEKGLYSHPAFVGTRAYVRGGQLLICLELGQK